MTGRMREGASGEHVPAVSNYVVSFMDPTGVPLITPSEYGPPENGGLIGAIRGYFGGCAV